MTPSIPPLVVGAVYVRAPHYATVTGVAGLRMLCLSTMLIDIRGEPRVVVVIINHDGSLGGIACPIAYTIVPE